MDLLCSSRSPIGVLNPCGHIFHQQCFTAWEKTIRQKHDATSNSFNTNRNRDFLVKCPTSCNPKACSKNRFIPIYLDLESFVIDDDDDNDDDDDDSSDDDDDDVIAVIAVIAVDDVGELCNINQENKKTDEYERSFSEDANSNLQAPITILTDQARANDGNDDIIDLSFSKSEDELDDNGDSGLILSPHKVTKHNQDMTLLSRSNQNLVPSLQTSRHHQQRKHHQHQNQLMLPPKQKLRN